MHHLKSHKKKFIVLSLLFLLTFSISCEDPFSTGLLTIKHIEFVQNDSNVFLDLPNGTVVRVPKNFNINDPSTWTGDLAQYVIHTYIYDITYEIENSGEGSAFSTEVDLHFC